MNFVLPPDHSSRSERSEPLESWLRERRKVRNWGLEAWLLSGPRQVPASLDLSLLIVPALLTSLGCYEDQREGWI